MILFCIAVLGLGIYLLRPDVGDTLSMCSEWGFADHDYCSDLQRSSSLYKQNMMKCERSIVSCPICLKGSTFTYTQQGWSDGSRIVNLREIEEPKPSLFCAGARRRY